MHPRSLLFGIGLLSVVAGCGSSDDRQWMKINERYTTNDFRRDLAECSKRGKLDDDCMRTRGWVAVTPRAEKPRDDDPRRNDPRRYTPPPTR